MVSLHHPKLQTAMERGYKAQLVVTDTDPTDPIRADKGAQTPWFCQGSDSSATAELHFST